MGGGGDEEGVVEEGGLKVRRRRDALQGGRPGSRMEDCVIRGTCPQTISLEAEEGRSRRVGKERSGRGPAKPQRLTMEEDDGV